MSAERVAAPETVAGWIRESDRVVVLTGAGISTESGIPDFRGPEGVWTRNPGAEARADISFYLADRAVRREAWRSRAEHPGLRAGSSPERTVEIHGSVREFVCLTCGERGPMEVALERVRAGEEDPACLVCGGILKSATISFGQALAARDLFRAQQAADEADLFLAIGTSLTVYPVAELPVRALRNRGRLVILNAEPTPLDGRAHAVLRGRLGEVLPAIVAAV